MPTRTEIFQDVLARRNQILWQVLAFQGGFMNTGGYIACHRFVSHVTGYGTYVGVALGEHDTLGAFEMALAPLFFLFGAAWAGWLVYRPLLQGREPLVLHGMLALAALNLTIFSAEESGFFGDFGEPLELQRDYALLFCLCLACGLQNGLFTALTGGKVRTTHLTGPTTDLGLNLAKLLALPRDDPERRQIAATNWLRVKIAVAFSGGALIATYVFAELTYEGFVVPSATSLFLLWYVRTLLDSVDQSNEPPA